MLFLVAALLGEQCHQQRSLTEDGSSASADSEVRGLSATFFPLSEIKFLTCHFSEG